MVANDVLRGPLPRSDSTSRQPVKPNDVDEYTIDLHRRTTVSVKGHRIMVQVQSTWFPLIDRNPQKFVPNIFEATDADFQPARQRIFRSPGQASYLQMPIDMNPPAEAAK